MLACAFDIPRNGQNAVTGWPVDDIRAQRTTWPPMPTWTFHRSFHPGKARDYLLLRGRWGVSFGPFVWDTCWASNLFGERKPGSQGIRRSRKSDTVGIEHTSKDGP